MRIVVTGATGFIGSAFCNFMFEQKHEVTAIVRNQEKAVKKLDKGIHILEMPLDELSSLEGTYDVFYHFAWNGSAGAAREDIKIQESNIGYTVEAMKAAKRCGCYRFVGAGSQAEYGVVKGVCSEETLPQPFMMYGATKLATYHMTKLLAKQLDIEFVWPRIYSVYGVGQNKDTLLSYVIESLKQGKEPELSSCENMWDFLNIKDCVEALKILGEHQEANGLYNISYGEPRKLKAFIEDVKKQMASDVALQFGVKKVDEKRTFWLEPNIDKMRKLNFSPRISFAEGISELIKEEA